MKGELVPTQRVEQVIVVLRGHRVILDSDLAALYGVETRSLVQAVRRNRQRFPEDFMLRLTLEEVQHLRSQSVISSAETANITGVSASKRSSRAGNLASQVATSRTWGGPRYLP